MPRKIEISYKTIIFTVFVLILLRVFYNIKDLILEFFAALLIMAILNPLVTKLSRYKIPRGVSIMIAYLIVIALFVFGVVGIMPPLIDQTTSVINNFPTYLGTLGINRFVSDQIINQLLSQIGSVPGQVISISVSVFSNVFSLLFILIVAFYLLIARDKLDDYLSFFFGEEKRVEFKRIIDILESKLGGWARGELALMVSIGLANYIGLSLLGIPYTISLSILAGLLEIVPYIGPIISAAVAVIIGLSISPFMGLAVLAMAFLIQQVENYIFVPKIMEKSVGVNPIVTLLALTIGFRLFGFTGVLLSIPVVITTRVLLNEKVLLKK
ncbi:AI-2E family transporter [Candidatus Woesebacteria bacterium]|nr:AI-2E family transporter [Candidatus Woesebacteria bacterium]